MIKVKYQDLQEGDKFRLTPPNTKINTWRGWQVVKVKDERIFRVERNGAVQLAPNGEPTDYKIYCCLSEEVYKV